MITHANLPPLLLVMQSSPIPKLQVPLLAGQQSHTPARTNSDSSIHRIRKDTINGYKEAHFSGKEAQEIEVEKLVGAQGFIPIDLVKGEVTWFYQSVFHAS